MFYTQIGNLLAPRNQMPQGVQDVGMAAQDPRLFRRQQGGVPVDQYPVSSQPSLPLQAMGRGLQGWERQGQPTMKQPADAWVQHVMSKLPRLK